MYAWMLCICNWYNSLSYRQPTRYYTYLQFKLSVGMSALDRSPVADIKITFYPVTKSKSRNVFILWGRAVNYEASENH